MEQPSVATVPNPSAATPPQVAPSPVSTTATPTTGQAGSTVTSSTEKAAAPSGDTFTQLDPNSLPPELKSKYDSMLSDYKKKTEEIAQQRKEFESVSDKVKLADMMISDPDFVNYWNSKYSNNTQQAQEQRPLDPAMVKQEVDVLKANLLVKDFKSAHPDFDELDSKGIITGYVQLNPPRSEREWKATLDKAYAYAKELRDGWIEQGRKEGLSRIAEKAQQSTQAPGTSTPPSFTGDAKKLSVSEAVDLARRGIKVS